MSGSRVVAPSPPRLGHQLAQLGCGDSLACSCLLAPVCSPACPPQSWSRCRTHFADGAPPVSAAGGACGAVAFAFPEPDVQGEATWGALDLPRGSLVVPRARQDHEPRAPHPGYR